MRKLMMIGLLGLALVTAASAQEHKKKKPTSCDSSQCSQPREAMGGPQRAEMKMNRQLAHMDSILNLSEEQEAQIQELNRQHREAIQKLNREHKMAIKAILTPEQQAIMKAQRQAMREQRDPVMPEAPIESPE
jgi:ABC-type iron transport system FetAB ATPase subunit